MAPNLFISYRRPKPHTGPSLAQPLADALRREWKADGQVFFDKQQVRHEHSFATDLVDDGLNASLALLLVVDAAWLHPDHLKRLRDTDKDWVYFEIRNAVEHGVFVLPVIEAAQLPAFKRAVLPPKLAWLQADRQELFVFDAGLSLADNTRRLAVLLRLRLRGHQRRPCALRATRQHNQPREVGIEAFEAQLERQTALHRLWRCADEYNSAWRAGFFALALMFAAVLFVAWLFVGPVPGPLFALAAAASVALGGWRCGPALRKGSATRLMARQTRLKQAQTK